MDLGSALLAVIASLGTGLRVVVEEPGFHPGLRRASHLRVLRRVLYRRLHALVE
jgi:hypothetical protein